MNWNSFFGTGVSGRHDIQQNDIQHNDTDHNVTGLKNYYAECRVFLSFVPSVVMLSVIMLCVVLLSVVMLNVVAP